MMNLNIRAAPHLKVGRKQKQQQHEHVLSWRLHGLKVSLHCLKVECYRVDIGSYM